MGKIRLLKKGDTLDALEMKASSREHLSGHGEIESRGLLLCKRQVGRNTDSMGMQ